MSHPRELSMIAYCLQCKTLFTQVVDAISLQQFSGQKGKKILEDYYEKLQRKYYSPNSTLLDGFNLVENDNNLKRNISSNSKIKKNSKTNNKFNDSKEDFQSYTYYKPPRYTYLVCPTCLECCHIGSVHTTIVETFGPDTFTPLSLCEWFKFHDDDDNDLADEEKGPPIYINMNADSNSKPKWELCHGIGPQRLELDSSRSGRLRKNVLRQYNLGHLVYDQYVPNTNIGAEYYRELMDLILSALVNKTALIERKLNPIKDSSDDEEDWILDGCVEDLQQLIDIIKNSKCIYEEFENYSSIFSEAARK